MGNADAKLVIRLANRIHGISPQTGLLNLIVEILDGELVAETVEGEADDAADEERLRILLGITVFGAVSAKLFQKLGELDGHETVLARFMELLAELPAGAFVESEIGQAVNAHPELLVAAAFTCEMGANGSPAYRLYRNPNIAREAAIGYLQHVHREFQAKKASERAQDPGANGSN